MNFGSAEWRNKCVSSLFIFQTRWSTLCSDNPASEYTLENLSLYRRSHSWTVEIPIRQKRKYWLFLNFKYFLTKHFYFRWRGFPMWRKQDFLCKKSQEMLQDIDSHTIFQIYAWICPSCKWCFYQGHFLVGFINITSNF